MREYIDTTHVRLQDVLSMTIEIYLNRILSCDHAKRVHLPIKLGRYLLSEISFFCKIRGLTYGGGITRVVDLDPNKVMPS